MQRRKGIDKSRIRSPLRNSGKTKKRTPLFDFADHLRNGHKGERIAIHHRRSGAQRRGGGFLQKQDPNGLYRSGSAKKAVELLQKTRDNFGADIRDQKRKTDRQNEYLEGNEEPLQTSEGEPEQSFPS